MVNIVAFFMSNIHIFILFKLNIPYTACVPENRPVHAMDGVSQNKMVQFGTKSARQNIIHNLDTYVNERLKPFSGHAAYR